MNREIIDKVAAYGFDVYMRNPEDTWLLFTDGKNIGYLQDNRFDGISLSTVHVPNSTTGTGFQVQRHGDSFDKATLEACFIIAPSWASSHDKQSVVKYRDMGAYLKSSSWHEGYKLIAHGAKDKHEG